MATAFLHSVMIQERRGMLKVWNLSVIVGAFALTTFGTFLTRGSILSSVHAFAQSAVGPMYLGFLVLVLVAGFGLIAARAWRLRSDGRLDSALSRESAFVGNNLVLLGITFIVLLGTIFPLVVEALTNRQVTVGGPYFKESTIPFFLLLLFLMGVGPLLPWRRASPDRIRRRVTVPAVAGASVMMALAVAGMRDLAALCAYGLAVFVLAANLGELVRGIRAHARATGTSFLPALPRAAGRNLRLFGGLVVHLGIAIVAIGVTTSTAFSHQTEVTLTRGAQASFQGFQLRYEGITALHQPQRTVEVASVSVSKQGHSLGRLTPSLNSYPSATDPIGTPSVRYGVVRDLYSSLIGFTGGGDEATFRFFLNPGVTWIWAGGAIVALGGLVAAWPSRRRGVSFEPPVPARELAGVG
jgi:cytochrome c-type biogenesis protein CcmF